MTQRRVDKKSMVFGDTMTRNGKTVTAPKGFWFQYDSSATGDKVRPNKKLWWRLIVKPDPKHITTPQITGDALPSYVWSNFKSLADFGYLRSELKDPRTTSEGLKASYAKWQLEEPEFPAMKSFLNDIAPLLSLNRYNQTAQEELRFKFMKHAGTAKVEANSQDILKFMDWRHGFPQPSNAALATPLEIADLKGVEINGKILLRNKKVNNRYSYWQTYDWLVLPTKPQDTTKLNINTSGIRYGEAQLRAYLKDKLTNVDLSIENLDDEAGVATVIAMELKSQENVYQAQTKLNKINSQSEELFTLMKSGKYDKKKLSELLGATRDLENFFKTWTERRDSLPWC